MNTTLWLRTASIASLLFTAGHTLGGRKDWSPFGETEVLKAMRTSPFVYSGVTRTYLDFYLGFGYLLSVYLLLQTILLWQLASAAKAGPAQFRPTIVAFTLASLASAILSWKFLFPVPAVFGLVVTGCLALAWWSAR
jgi:hypothetical protein